MKTAITFLFLAASSTAGYAGQSDAKIYRGEYFYNFETASFTPQGSTESWCVDSSKLKQAELPPDGTPGGPWGTADIVVRGVLSEKGSYCNLGAYKYFLDITDVLEIHNRKRRTQ